MIQPPTTQPAQVYRALRSPDAQLQAAAFEQVWDYLLPVALHIVQDQPDGSALAQDCAQQALVRIHQHLEECLTPAAFFGWARRIVSNLAIDELRRRKRLLPVESEEEDDQPGAALPDPHPSPEAVTLDQLTLEGLAALLQRAPISPRSRRVVQGRYLEDLPDEQLARQESQLLGAPVLPSHIQVTRTKDLARLRDYPPLRAFID